MESYDDAERREALRRTLTQREAAELANMENSAIVETVGEDAEYNEQKFYRGEEFVSREHANRLMAELCLLKCIRPDQMLGTLHRFMQQHLD